MKNGKSCITKFIIKLSLFIIPLFFCSSVFSAKTQRIIEYIKIDRDHNPDLNRYGMHFRSKIIRSVFNLEIPAFDKNTGTILNKDSVEKRLTYEETTYDFSDEVYRVCLEGVDLNKLGIESIILKNNNRYSTIQNIHFYTDEIYRFSLTYKDFKSIASDVDYLIARNQNGPYWKNSIFLTHGDYMVDWSEYHRQLIVKVSNSSRPVKDFKTSTVVENKSILNLLDTSLNTSCCQFYNNRALSRHAIGYEIYNDPKLWGINDKYEFVPNEQILSGHNKPKEVYTLTDYFSKKLYQIEETEFIKSPKSDKKASLSELDIIEPYRGRIECQFSEAVLTSNEDNQIFHDIYPSFMKALVEYALDAKLTPYYNDSLTSFGSLEDVKLSLTRPRLDTYKSYFDYKSYKLGDTILLDEQLYSPKNILPKKRPYSDWADDPFSSISISQADGSFLPITSQDQFDSTEWHNLGKLKIEYFDLNEIDNLECNFVMSFDENGNDLRYELKSITIFISAIATGNSRGIQTPIATYDWQEVKLLFPNKEFISAMENRDYFSYYLKTSIVKPSIQK